MKVCCARLDASPLLCVHGSWLLVVSPWQRRRLAELRVVRRRLAQALQAPACWRKAVAVPRQAA